MVESTRGFFRMEEIAKCHPRTVSLSLGSEDFAADVGMPRSSRVTLRFVKMLKRAQKGGRGDAAVSVTDVLLCPSGA